MVFEFYVIRIDEAQIARITRYESGRGAVERWIVPQERAEQSVLERWREEHARQLRFRPPW